MAYTKARNTINELNDAKAFIKASLESITVNNVDDAIDLYDFLTELEGIVNGKVKNVSTKSRFRVILDNFTNGLEMSSKFTGKTATYSERKGRTTFDDKAFASDHSEMDLSPYYKTGAPTVVLSVK